jgi:hypothetical protein
MMPKLSVSIPDELWEQAQAASPDMGQSQLVQVALRRYVAGMTGRWPLVRSRSEENRALLQQVLERVSERTQATYDEGYRAGLALAESSPWKLVEQLAELDWDLDAWKSGYGQRYGQWDEPAAEDKYFWECVDGANSPQYQHDATFRAGFADGLRDLWRALTGEESGARRRTAEGEIDPDELPFE